MATLDSREAHQPEVKPIYNLLKKPREISARTLEAPLLRSGPLNNYVAARCVMNEMVLYAVHYTLLGGLEAAVFVHTTLCGMTTDMHAAKQYISKGKL